MSDLSKKARAAMRAKASRMASGSDPSRRVDASSWTPTEPLNADKKTGARPIRPRIYKNGGAVQGDRGPRRADKSPRSAATEIANAKVNRNVPAANAEEFGKYHVGGFKKGGEARKKRDMGGPMQDPRATAQAAMQAASARSGTSPNRMEFGPHGGKSMFLKKGGTAEKGDRAARKSGGRTKGKTNINIVIQQPHPQGAQAPNNAPVRPPMPPPPPPSMPPPPMPMGAPPGGPGGPPIPPPSMAGGPGAGMPMMPRRSGGRTVAGMTAGAGSGLGRLEKIQLQKNAR